MKRLAKRELEVLAAVKEGAQTAADLADKVGMTRSCASVYLGILTSYRAIKQTGIRRMSKGRPVHVYGVAST